MPDFVEFTAEEVQDIEWAQLVLMGVSVSDIPNLSRHDIAMLFAVHRVQNGL